MATKQDHKTFSAVPQFMQDMVISFISGLSSFGAEVLWQKMVDKSKTKATTVLQSLYTSITNTASKNGITLN